MKTNSQNLTRQVLFTDTIITATNEQMTYIVTGIKSVTSNISKVTNTYIDTIKKLLKSKSLHSALIILGKVMKKRHRELRASEWSEGVRNQAMRQDLRQLAMLRKELRKGL